MVTKLEKTIFLVWYANWPTRPRFQRGIKHKLDLRVRIPSTSQYLLLKQALSSTVNFCNFYVTKIERPH